MGLVSQAISRIASKPLAVISFSFYPLALLFIQFDLRLVLSWKIEENSGTFEMVERGCPGRRPDNPWSRVGFSGHKSQFYEGPPPDPSSLFLHTPTSPWSSELIYFTRTYTKSNLKPVWWHRYIETLSHGLTRSRKTHAPPSLLHLLLNTHMHSINI